MSFLRLTLLLFPVLLFADSGKYLILLFLIKLSHFPAKTYFISFVSWNQVHVEMEYGLSCRLPDFATFSILTTEKYIENTAFGLYFFTSML